MTPPLPRSEQQVPDVLRHLRHLTRSFVHDGERISYVGIYARPSGSRREPPFTLLTARESGFEGIACLDDAARAAMLALQVYEETGDPAALRLARAWLRFVTYMQEPDGRFPTVNLFVDHSQIVRLECLRSGIWGTASTWGRVVTYDG